MFRNKISAGLLFVMVLSAYSWSYAQSAEAEIYTLFTTAQERQIIDKNRYKLEQEKKNVVQAGVDKPEQTEKAIPVPASTLNIMLSGVTIAQSGENIAWLNGKAYENGASLEDGSKVYISRKTKTLVQIQTPDGKYHALTTGKTIDISYFKPLEG